ncbi:MAG: hypothetical protein RR744_00240 [Cellulosilyticaceae bacterium]
MFKLKNIHDNYIEVNCSSFYGFLSHDEDKDIREFIINESEDSILLIDGDDCFYRIKPEDVILVAPVFLPDENGKYDIPKEYLKCEEVK